MDADEENQAGERTPLVPQSEQKIEIADENQEPLAVFLKDFASPYVYLQTEKFLAHPSTNRLSDLLTFVFGFAITLPILLIFFILFGIGSEKYVREKDRIYLWIALAAKTSYRVIMIFNLIAIYSYCRKRGLHRKLFNLGKGIDLNTCQYKEFKKRLGMASCMLLRFQTLVLVALMIAEFRPIPLHEDRTKTVTNGTNIVQSRIGDDIKVLLIIDYAAIPCVDILLTFLPVFILYIFMELSNIRLEQLKREFVNWEKSVEEAINRFQTFYADEVNKSSKDMSWLFLIHNMSMIIMIPIFSYNLALFSVNYSHIKIGYSLGYLIFQTLMFILAWALPLYFANKVETNEELFKEDINKVFIKPDESEIENETVATREKTFRARKQVQMLLSYLKTRKSGFRAFGFKLQVRMSYISTFVSFFIYFLAKTGLMKYLGTPTL
eukprot:Seg6722.1 transcript_id=Seg6722.1/GoldUCD/mRNA.D3Y31 product="hypothetical protein" protein_id=Seg6722.1/GoldUCD/D3Y31